MQSALKIILIFCFCILHAANGYGNFGMLVAALTTFVIVLQLGYLQICVKFSIQFLLLEIH